MGQASHQLWHDDHIYVRLDLPQVPGLLSELVLTITVCLETRKWLFYVKENCIQ